MSISYKFRVVSVSVSVLMLSSVAMSADLGNGSAKFSSLCAMCHGPTGKGDGPTAAAFPPDQKPSSLVDGKYKYATDEAKFKELMQKGGGGVGLSPLMPPQPSLTESDLADIYAFIQSLKN